MDLMEHGKAFLREMDLKDAARLKLCLFSVGVLAGLGISDRRKKGVGRLAKLVFFTTYLPLMAKFLRTGVPEED